MEASFRAGMMVTPRIRLERLLGEGGMGAVWVAEHLALGTRVAVKFVSPELWQKHPEVAARFAREASAAARMQSPHVVRTYDFGSMDDGTPFLVMELLEGESLASRLEREGSLSPAATAPIIEQVAKALDEAHRLGIVHRDVKPGNIFLTMSGRELFAKLLDFGIARDVASAAGNATQTGVMLGTAKYMSPEQLLSAKSVDAQADLWALAVTAYECVVGTAPFRGETMPGLIIAIHGRQFDAPSSTRSKSGAAILPELDGFFARAFSSLPADRFGSSLDLADAFNRVARPEWAAAQPIPDRTSFGAPLPIARGAAPIAGAQDAGSTQLGAGAAGRVAGQQLTELGSPVATGASMEGRAIGNATELGSAAPIPAPPPSALARTAQGTSRQSASMAPWIAAAAFGAIALGIVAWVLTRSPASTTSSDEETSEDGDAPRSGKKRAAASASASVSAASSASAPAPVSAAPSSSTPSSSSSAPALAASDPACLPTAWDSKIRGWAKHNVPICRTSKRGFYARAAKDKDKVTSLTAVQELWKTYLASYAGERCPVADEMVFFDPDGSSGAGILFAERPERWDTIVEKEEPWLLRDSSDRPVSDPVCFFLVTDGRATPGW